MKKLVLKTKFKEKIKKLIVDHYLLKNTPFGIQETLITQDGHIDIWEHQAGFKWSYTEMYRAVKDNNFYSNRQAVFKAIAESLNVDLVFNVDF